MASIDISVDGQSEWIPLRDGENVVAITCPSWSTSSLAMRYSHDGTNANSAKVRKDVGGTEVTVTENEPFVASGPGYIGAVMSTYGGTPVTITTYSIRQPVAG